MQRYEGIAEGPLETCAHYKGLADIYVTLPPENNADIISNDYHRQLSEHLLNDYPSLVELKEG